MIKIKDWNDLTWSDYKRLMRWRRDADGESQIVFDLGIIRIMTDDNVEDLTLEELAELSTEIGNMFMGAPKEGPSEFIQNEKKWFVANSTAKMKAKDVDTVSRLYNEDVKFPDGFDELLAVIIKDEVGANISLEELNRTLYINLIGGINLLLTETLPTIISMKENGNKATTKGGVE